MQQAHVFTIPADQPFALTLAQSLLADYGDDFVSLSQVQILLPNRRSCRTVAEAFLTARNGQPCLLPRLSPIGDINEDELALHDILDINNPDIPPAIAPLERQMVLGQLIQAQRPNLPPAQVFALSAQLAALIDDVHTEGLDWHNLEQLVPGELSHHWQITIDFLRIVFEHWPAILADRGLVDPAERRNLILQHYTDQLRSRKTTSRIIAAGSTGSIAATRDLLRTIAYLPQGSVILSGLDTTMPETEWASLTDTHAQFYLKNLIDHIGISRPDIAVWSGTKATKDVSPRTTFLQQCVSTASDPSLLAVKPQALDGILSVQATQPQQEARIVALKIRETVEDPSKSVLVVTSDRTLAQRIEAELGRWDIRVNDAAGLPFLQTRVGLWLDAVAGLLIPDSQAVALLSMLHHPFADLGYAPADYQFHVKWFERYILRGPRWQGGLADLVSVTQNRMTTIPLVHHEPLTVLATKIADAITTAQPQLQHTLSEWLEMHLQLAETLAATDSKSGAEIVWHGDSGETAAQLLQDLRLHAPLNTKLMTASAYRDFIAHYLKRQTYRPRYPLHPRINILGPIEARLQHADLVILAGLNETVWPRETPHDPFMSQPMRQQFGLAPFARRIGQSALDFYLLAHAPNIFITYSATREGTSVAPARWLQQMQVVLQKHKLQLATDGIDWIELADSMDAPEQITPGTRPAFSPPLSARPRQLSVSNLDQWRRDPYGLYARKILGLYLLEAPESDAAARDWGNVVHQMLDQFIGITPFSLANWQSKSRQALDALALPVDIWAQWHQRLNDIGFWLNEHQLVAGRGYTEITGRYTFNDLDFTVTGRADLVDVQDNQIVISDYKTGGAKRSGAQMLNGYAPQLPFLGLMAEQGGFSALPAKPVGALHYIEMTGKASEPITISKHDKNVSDMLKRNQALFARLIQQFNQPDTPYITQPHPKYINAFNDYAHLERVQEWSSAEGEDL